MHHELDTINQFQALTQLSVPPSLIHRLPIWGVKSIYPERVQLSNPSHRAERCLEQAPAFQQQSPLSTHPLTL
jgi:hypothetical protein